MNTRNQTGFRQHVLQSGVRSFGKQRSIVLVQTGEKKRLASKENYAIIIDEDTVHFHVANR